MKVEPDFLPLPIQDWESSEEFKRARDFVFHVKVTNDVAERGIGMAKDYMKILTTSSDLREKLFEAVEWDRRKYKDYKKETLNKTKMYLITSVLCIIYCYKNKNCSV